MAAAKHANYEDFECCLLFVVIFSFIYSGVIAGFMRERKPGYFAAGQDENSGAQANGVGTMIVRKKISDDRSRRYRVTPSDWSTGRHGVNSIIFLRARRRP
jgi:hypothetical protein